LGVLWVVLGVHRLALLSCLLLYLSRVRLMGLVWRSRRVSLRLWPSCRA
jgi:hypothetical protein